MTLTYYYTARGGAETGSGLTCTINIYKVSDGTQVVTSGVMTEIGSTGEYYYAYSPTLTDSYLGIMNSAEKPSEKRVILGEEIGDSGTGTGWATTGTAYELSGLTSDDIGTSVMANFCERADLQVEGDIFIRHTNILLNEKPDGTRTQFRVPIKSTYPVGDKDRSSSTDLEANDAADITVYGITHNDSTGYDESTVLTVSTINSARDGRFTLSSAPASTYLELRTDYVTYLKGTKFQQVRTAASYLAAHFALLAKLGEEIPSGYSYKAGNFSISKGEASNSFVRMLNLTWQGYKNSLHNMNLVGISGA